MKTKRETLQHMPGPWVARWRRGWRVTTEQIDGDDESSSELIARVSGVPANAPLIAAAPDLLAALKGILAITDRKHVAWDRAREAIAKAEGK